MSTAVYREDEEVVADTALWLLFAAAIYLGLPVIMFSGWWLNAGAAIISIALVLHALLSQPRPTGVRNNLWKIPASLIQKNALAFVLLFVWCALSGTGGFGFQNSDYAASNALLKDLTQNPWPLKLREGVPLVYYVVYYLPAAFVGKYLGWQHANNFIFFWTYIGLMISWCMFSLAMRLDDLSFGRRLLSILVFILFGGFDFLGALLSYGNGALTPGLHIEWWASLGQFSSTTTLLFWVPQHTLAPWIVTSAILLVLERQIGQQIIWLLAAMSLLWSPVASLGLLPFLVILAVRELRTGNIQNMLSSANLFAGPTLAATAMLFYSSNAFKFPSNWQFSAPGFTRNFLLLFFLETVFVALPFFSQHLKAKVYLNQIDLPPPAKLTALQKVTGWTAILALLVLPTYKMGFMNDLCMRASIPALMFLLSFWVRILRREFTYQYIPMTVTLLCLLLGSGSAINEINRALANYQFGIPKIDNVATLLNDPQNEITEQRAGKSDSIFWRWLGPQGR